jgi:NADH-quinone oxidoreductase subunit N
MPLAPPIPWSALLPETVLLVAGCAVLLLGQSTRRTWAPWVTLGSLVVAVVLAWIGGQRGSEPTGSGLAYGSLAAFVRLAALELGIVLTLANWSQARSSERGEFLALMLFSLTGLLLVGAADNLLILFLALELVSIPGYIMVVLGRTNVRAVEAGTKYFYLGALSAALMAYGFAFLYGVAGNAELSQVLPAVDLALHHPGSVSGGLAVLGIVLSLAGLLFKLAAVPLHFYIADVYQGAASPVAGFLGFVPKLAGLVAIFKLVLLTGDWGSGGAAVYWLLWIVAVASMCVGNILALRQTNIKRMLAYSGVAHAGYMLVGVVAGPEAGKAVSGDGIGVLGDGAASVLYYVVIYGLANLAAFAVLGLLRTYRRPEARAPDMAAKQTNDFDSGAGVTDVPCETLRDVAGLLRREPVLALLLALAMFTLMGLPPTPGFWGKLNLFGSAVTLSQLTGNTSLVVLVVIAVLNSALAAAYYLRVVAAVLLYDNDRPAFALPREAQNIGALLCGFLLIIFAFYPGGLLTAGRTATRELRNQVAVVQTVPPAPTDTRVGWAQAGQEEVGEVGWAKAGVVEPSDTSRVRRP